jgi:Sec-independent protein translocase protein TatA
MGKAIREFRSTVSGKDDDSEDQEAVEAGTEGGKKT